MGTEVKSPCTEKEKKRKKKGKRKERRKRKEKRKEYILMYKFLKLD